MWKPMLLVKQREANCVHVKKGFAVKYNSVQIDFFQNKKSNCSSGFDLSGEKSDDMTSIFRRFKPAGGLTIVVSLRCMLMQ